MKILEGKVAVVTGAGGGIGRSEALSLAARGAAVVVNDIGQDAAEAVAAEITARGGRAVAGHGDVSDWKATAGLVGQALSEFGRLDIVVANAGVVRRSAIADVTEDDLDTQLAVLFKGTYGLVRHAAELWRDQAADQAADQAEDQPADQAGGQPADQAAHRLPAHRAMVLTSSSAGVPGGVQEFSVYGAMKAAIAALALSAALELRPCGVTVNAILPHAATPMDAQAKGLPDYQRFAPGSGDPLNPEHVANVVAYLASDRAAWLSGQVFEITGTEVRQWRPWSPGPAVTSDEQWTPAALDTALATAVYGTLPGGRVIPGGR